MVASAAYNITLSIGDGASPIESFLALNGVQLTNLRLQHEAINNSQMRGNAWQLRLERAGGASLEISLEGVFLDTGATALLQSTALAHSQRNIRIQLANDDVIEGAFIITLFERYGTIGEMERFNTTLLSAGIITLG